MSDEITVCPHCDSPCIRKRIKDSWYCSDCKTPFDEPNRRARKAEYKPAGLAGDLMEDDTELAL